MSHENSIGIDLDGRFINLPTVQDGAQLDNEEAVKLFLQGKLKPLGMYSTQVEADREAVKRSNAAGKEHEEKAPPAAAAPPSGLSMLLDILKSGFRATGDAFQQDVDSLKERRPPEQAQKAIMQILSTMGNPAVNQPVPQLVRYSRVFDPKTGWESDLKKQVVNGGDWLTLFMRQGGLGQFLETMLKQYERRVFK